MPEWRFPALSSIAAIGVCPKLGADVDQSVGERSGTDPIVLPLRDDRTWH
jgi:hypothetical protein